MELLSVILATLAEWRHVGRMVMMNGSLLRSALEVHPVGAEVGAAKRQPSPHRLDAPLVHSAATIRSS